MKVIATSEVITAVLSSTKQSANNGEIQIRDKIIRAHQLRVGILKLHNLWLVEVIVSFSIFHFHGLYSMLTKIQIQV